MKKKKYLFALMATVLSSGLLFGCNNGVDEQEPDPTEEPSEQKKQDERKNENNNNNQ
ncbi:Lipoprotein [Bacillus pseudomycoides]|nr:hypothetical protein [Bacillus pseudomycoides]